MAIDDPGEGGLVASRALALLDEFRVPYAVEQRTATTGPWHAVSTGSPTRAVHWYAPPAATAAAAALHRVAGIPAFGRVAPESAVVAHARALGGDWKPWPQMEVHDRRGQLVATARRSPEGGTILPFDPDEVALSCRAELYRKTSAAVALARRSYYAARRLMPRSLQVRLRRGYTRVQERATFPRWPFEPALHDLTEAILQCVADAVGDPIPTLAPWPDGRRWALVLTHDVETATGRDAIDPVRAAEARAGLPSSWNLVPERYHVSDDLVARLAADGCEVGVHGLRHDGRDLALLSTLRRRLPEMRRWAERWGAVGFRSPATQRVWEWMPMLGFDYDSSYPDTDPYEPVPGGCCSWLPFFNGDLVELPITVPQDHTVFVVLRQGGEVWHSKVDLLRRRGGMALVLTHPDYMIEGPALGAYEELLGAYATDPTAWVALPREVSAWWRRRAATTLRRGPGGWTAEGPAAGEAAITAIVPSSRPVQGSLP